MTEAELIDLEKAMLGLECAGIKADEHPNDNTVHLSWRYSDRIRRDVPRLIEIARRVNGATSKSTALPHVQTLQTREPKNKKKNV